MGFRFALQHANWLAHILQPSGPIPTLEHEFEARETLRKLLKAAAQDFYGARLHRFEFYRAIEEADGALSHKRPIAEVLQPLRMFFRDVPWIALLIPSGEREFDRFLASREVLEELVHIRPGDPGLILQLDESPREQAQLELGNVFPAFRVALAHATRWPGVLLWTPSGDAAFFDIPVSRSSARSALRWIFSHLAILYGSPDLSLLQEQYKREHIASTQEIVPLRMLHLSDLHLGSRIAQRRLPRVKQLIQQIAAELGEHAPIVPVVTGDLMDTPDEAHLDSVRDFIEFLYSVGSEDPVIILGNHDVRRDGWLSPDLQQALRIQIDRTRWFDQAQVGLACFNSVRSGRLARGCIDETEMMDVGVSLDRERGKVENYVLAGLLHHHPLPVERPAWYRQDWFERWLGRTFEKTDALENAEHFLSWLRARNIGLVLHGHKHIPRLDLHGGMMVVGCGSSVGKVRTQEQGTTYMSINVITIDAARSRVSCRLRAERIPGGGLTSGEDYETVLTAPVFNNQRGNP